MKNKDEKQNKIKSIKSNVLIECNAVVSTKEGIDILNFVKNGNDYMAEPNCPDGCIVALKVTSCKFSKDKDKPKIENKGPEDKLDRYLHFSFRGIRFTVDTEERNVMCNGKGLEVEMASGRDDTGLYMLNVESSN
jgi:hypothetical protein